MIAIFLSEAAARSSGPVQADLFLKLAPPLTRAMVIGSGPQPPQARGLCALAHASEVEHLDLRTNARTIVQTLTLKAPLRIISGRFGSTLLRNASLKGSQQPPDEDASSVTRAESRPWMAT